MSKALTGPVQVVAQGIFDDNVASQHNLGEVIFANDGRAFKYCSAGATALVAGSLYQSKVENTSDADLAVAAASAGALSIVTTSTVTVSANEYAGGFVVVNTTPGLGQVLKIKSHPAASAAVLTISLEDEVQVALTTVSRISLVANPYKDLIINPTTLTSAPAGVGVKAITAEYFGWLGVAGAQPVLCDGANAVGANLVASNGAAGAVEDAAAPGAQPLVGTALITGAASDVIMANLHLL